LANRDVSEGTRVNDTNSDMSVEVNIVMKKCRNW